MFRGVTSTGGFSKGWWLASLSLCFPVGDLPRWEEGKQAEISICVGVYREKGVKKIGWKMSEIWLKINEIWEKMKIFWEILLIFDWNLAENEYFFRVFFRRFEELWNLPIFGIFILPCLCRWGAMSDEVINRGSGIATGRFSTGGFSKGWWLASLSFAFLLWLSLL